MPSQPRKDLLEQRRRARNNDTLDDSASEGSLPSDADDADADYSDLSDGEDLGNDRRPAKSTSSKQPSQKPKTIPNQPFQTVKETEVMLNGLSLEDEARTAEPIDFDSLDKETEEAVDSSKPKLDTSERKTKDSEDYKKRLEMDPAFIPTRGAFFMHDHRGVSPGQNNFRVMRGGGRGRGRNGPVVGPFSPNNGHPSEQSSRSQWSHDLHDTLLEPAQKTGAPSPGPVNQYSKNPQQPAPKSFSTTQLLGKVVIMLSLPGMIKPKTFRDVPVNRYTKLPNHRPPLRRDKPVRVFIPHHPVRYIFPALDRSFIFIPRNLRPNQQGFGRGRGKGLGSMGGISSRRTSIYGGSMYSPSMGMSRRSSIARESMMASPAGSMMSSRPVVRLPPGSHHPAGSIASIHGPGSSTGTPSMVGGPFAPPRPPYRENWSNVQMHQPRPQKTISVTGIEIPAATHIDTSMPDHAFDPQVYGLPQQQQPFHHQIPSQVNGQDPYGHVRQPSYPVQAGTPLSNIPERAIHAQPFQPYPGAYPTYPQQQQQPAYFYPHPNAYAPQGPVMAPVFVPQQYMMQNAGAPQGGTTSGMVAHEQNGMVYYIDPSQMSQQQQQPQQQQEAYPAQNTPYAGMPMMMAQPPDGYYYPPPQQTGPVYYAPQ